MLVVGEDTFVSVNDAGAYIQKYYLATDEKFIAWSALSEGNKEVYLRRACQELCLLHYVGVVYTAFQPLPFPRFVGDDYVMAYRTLIAPEAVLYPEMQAIQQDIISAQIEEALELCSPSADTEAFNAKNGAVDSYTIGHLSEHYKASTATAEQVLRSTKAQTLVQKYVNGAYDVD